MNDPDGVSAYTYLPLHIKLEAEQNAQLTTKKRLEKTSSLKSFWCFYC